jgi:hypothetical protein
MLQSRRLLSNAFSLLERSSAGRRGCFAC